jgi:8-oxo-dGTP pyrophosphatase MutT (NUDIX family)
MSVALPPRFDHRDHPEAGTQVPAGRVHEGESLIDAAIREILEETGECRFDPAPELSPAQAVSRSVGGLS